VIGDRQLIFIADIENDIYTIWYIEYWVHISIHLYPPRPIIVVLPYLHWSGH